MIALWTAPQGGAWTRLPGPVTAWSILRTDRLGKDSFRVELADAALPDGRLRFSARVDGVQRDPHQRRLDHRPVGEGGIGRGRWRPV